MNHTPDKSINNMLRDEFLMIGEKVKAKMIRYLPRSWTVDVDAIG